MSTEYNEKESIEYKIQAWIDDLGFEDNHLLRVMKVHKTIQSIILTPDYDKNEIIVSVELSNSK